MLEAEVFILKLVSIDGLAFGSVVVSEITTLAHESWDDSVEGGSLVSESFLSSTESPEVLSSLRTTSPLSSMVTLPSGAPSAARSKNTRVVII